MSQKRNWSLAVAAACTQYKSYDDDDEDNDDDDDDDDDRIGLNLHSVQRLLFKFFFSPILPKDLFAKILGRVEWRQKDHQNHQHCHQHPPSHHHCHHPHDHLQECKR